MLNTTAYLDRIAYSGGTEPSAETLRALHRAHMLAVPFENLDIQLGRPIVCAEESFLHKIVTERRGGFCYELNGAFAALLRALGFRVAMLSARVAGADGRYGREFDHLTLRVVDTFVDARVDTRVNILRDVVPTGPHSTWLADVGFGDSFIEPLLLQPDLAQSQNGRLYRVVESGSQSNGESKGEIEGEIESVFYMEVKDEVQTKVKIEAKPLRGSAEEEKPIHENWKRKFSFTLEPRQLSDFAAMCRYHQTSPESHFTRQRLCSRATPEGRITLSDRKLIETREGSRTERELAGDREWRATLRGLFQIDLPG